MHTNLAKNNPVVKKKREWVSLSRTSVHLHCRNYLESTQTRAAPRSSFPGRSQSGSGGKQLPLPPRLGRQGTSAAMAGTACCWAQEEALQL